VDFHTICTEVGSSIVQSLEKLIAPLLDKSVGLINGGKSPILLNRGWVVQPVKSGKIPMLFCTMGKMVVR
jgi:hypothetical protein